MTNNLYDLDSITPSQRLAVGDKAVVLSRLAQAGFPVPSGVVVGSQVLRSLLNRENALTAAADSKDYRKLQQIAQTSLQRVDEFTLDSQWCEALYQKLVPWETETVIFRPSLVFPPPTRSLAGLLSSHCGLCEKKDIELGLKRVWGSFFRARNLFYWQQQGIRWEDLGLAVLIQPMQSAIASGILEVNSQQYSVQAVRGLGHSLMQGEVLPEIYEINPDDQQVNHHQLGYQTRIYELTPELDSQTLEKEAEQEILTATQLSQLLDLAVTLRDQITETFRCEWTFLPRFPSENGQERESQLYLVQLSSEGRILSQMNSQGSQFNSETAASTQESQVLVRGIGSATGKATGTVYVVGKDDAQPLPSAAVVVTSKVNADTLPLIKQAKALITEEGGVTSHGAILARELKIPAVVGVEGAVSALIGETEVTVDGDQGAVLRGSPEETPAVATPSTPKQTEAPILATQLMVNVSQRDRASELAQLPVDGIGLIRSEFMLLELLAEHSFSTWLSDPYREQFIQRLADLIGDLAEAFFPRPIFYRSTDWVSLQSSELPFLGERGTYSYYQNPEFFSAQVFALRYLQHHGYHNINLILPFVRSPEEVQFCKKMLTEMGVEKNCQLWMMAEVPSVVYLLPEYIQAGIEGIAIGTNDLTQLLLGANRNQSGLHEHYNERHPALRAALKTLIQTARQEEIPCSVCGQGVVLYPELVADLVRWGVTSISVEEAGIETTYRAIARSEKRLLLDAAIAIRNQP